MTIPPTGARVGVYTITVGPLQENCYVVADLSTKQAVVVDPGYEGSRILREVESLQLKPCAIWLTHGHVDHVGAISELLSAQSLPVYMHPADVPLYERAAESGRLYGMPFEQPPLPDRDLADGDELLCGEIPFKVVHVPGHSPGQVAFIGNGVCLSGDLLFAGSIGRTDLPLSDPRAMQRSLLRIASYPESLVVYPGHGEATTLASEKATNPFLRGLAGLPVASS